MDENLTREQMLRYVDRAFTAHDKTLTWRDEDGVLHIRSEEVEMYKRVEEKVIQMIEREFDERHAKEGEDNMPASKEMVAAAVGDPRLAQVAVADAVLSELARLGLRSGPIELSLAFLQYAATQEVAKELKRVADALNHVGANDV